MTHSLHYLPSIEYINNCISSDSWQLNANDVFEKQTPRNRATILTSQGTQPLIIPVHFHSGMFTKEVKIDYQQRWTQIHLGALKTNYNNAPFFEFYFPEMETIYLKKHTFLIDLNLEFLSLCLHFLRLPIEEINKKITLIEKIDDYSQKAPLNNPSLNSRQYVYKPYKQVFGQRFVENLSIYDLLFNHGVDSFLYI
jgi:hypothetical protein